MPVSTRSVIVHPSSLPVCQPGSQPLSCTPNADPFLLGRPPFTGSPAVPCPRRTLRRAISPAPRCCDARSCGEVFHGQQLSHISYIKTQGGKQYPLQADQSHVGKGKGWRMLTSGCRHRRPRAERPARPAASFRPSAWRRRGGCVRGRRGGRRRACRCPWRARSTCGGSRR